MKITVAIAKSCKAWKAHSEVVSVGYIKKIVQIILRRFPNLNDINHVELSVLLTDNEQIQSLNEEFRGKAKPTNVLSFPDIELNYQHLLEFQPNLEYMYLGDIAFCYQVICDEARAQGKSFGDHFTHLAVHSILHLLGFDHQDKCDQTAMEKLEVEILKELSIKSPY